MKFTPIADIVVSPNRQRREFPEEAMAELRDSIENSEYGLLQPIVTRRDKGKTVLVAGERRLRACSDIYALGGSFNHAGSPVPAGCVPTSDIGELDPLAAEEAELDENIKRVDLTWSERAAVTTRLANLRAAQAAQIGHPAPTTADIAAEVAETSGITKIAAHDTTRKQLIVARHLDDPEVRAAPTLNEAFKVLKKKEEVRQNVLLAERVGLSFTAANHSLIQGNAKDWALSSPGERFDIILTDPPYGMGADEFGDSGNGASAHVYDDSYEAWQEMIGWFAPESFRLAKSSACLYAFCDIDRFPEFRAALTTAGWRVHRTPLIWANLSGFRVPWPGHGPQRAYELILFAIKGDFPTTVTKKDYLEYARDSSEGYAAQKPVPLLLDLLRRSARPGMSVLDPFGGSGSTLVACHDLKLPCTIIEKLPEAFGIIARRAKALNAQPELPL